MAKQPTLVVYDDADSSVKSESATLFDISPGEQLRGTDIFDIAVEPHDIRRYGADPTGANSSAAALQEAIECCWRSGGGFVRVPIGAWLIDTPIHGRSNVIIEGAGYGSELRVANGSAWNDNVIKFEAVSNCGVRNLRLNGNRGQTGGGTRYGIYFGGVQQAFVDTVWVHALPGDGIHLYNCDRSRVFGCWSWDNFYHGIEIEQCRNTSAAVNQCYENLRHGIYVFQGEVGASGSKRIALSLNACTRNTQYGIAVQGELCEDITVSTNTCSENGQYGITIFDRVKGATVSANIITLNGFHGLYLYRIEGCSIRNNRFHNNSQATNGGYQEVMIEGDAIQWGRWNSFGGNLVLIDGGIKAAYAFKENSVNDGPNIVQGNIIPNAGTAGKIAVLYEATQPSSFSLCRGNIGRLSEARGTATFNGDGVTTVFPIPHGMTEDEPRYETVGAGSPDAAGDFSWAVDPTNITVTFTTPPVSGTGNVILRWKAEI